MDELEKFKKNLSVALWTCALSDSRPERIKVCKDIIKAFDNVDGVYKSFNDMVDKLTAAAETIKDQNELLECFYAVTGPRSSDIVTTWKTLKKIKKERLKKGR